ncbi:MAG: DUF1963 domain-containing protein [Bifidobacteriaceae bacterium]|jgi:uncharacterized protein YwqG|nr:DUF1963 domain-containing protein [Bifidobacteriaceae bacterium]
MSLLTRIFRGEPEAAPAGAARLGAFHPAGAGAPGEFEASWLAATGAAGAALSVAPGEAGPLDCKVGGQPYLPPGAPWPTAGPALGGRPLFHLAQLNLAQLPPLPGWPPSGLLQFFIAGGDTHGMRLEDLACGAGHAVLYHPEPAQAPAWGAWPPGPHPDAPAQARPIRDLELPFVAERAARLAARPVTVPLCRTDCRSQLRALDLANPAAGAAGWPYWPQAAAWRGHLAGGNPFFLGDDPRAMPAYASFTTLLLQLDSDPAAALNWGEGGLCNFFIEPERLAALDFSRVLYHWDCR